MGWLKRWVRGESVALFSAAGVLAVSFLYIPGRMPPISRCLFSEVTGIPCPLCGMTHSFCAMARGRLIAAFAFHPVGPILFVGTVAVLFVGLRDALARESLLRRFASRIPLENPWLYLYVFSALWVAKLASFLVSGSA